MRAVWQDPPIDVPIKYHGLLYVKSFTIWRMANHKESMGVVF